MNAALSFIAELRRRNVLRAVVLYAGAVWALAQGIAALAPVVGAPAWSARAFLVASAIGFPFWIAFAWLYEFTAQGLKRESDIAADASVTRSRGRRLDLAIIAVLTIAVVLLLTDQFVWRKGVLPHDDAAAIPAKSVAVLPFHNLSGDPKNDYFSDGVTEEIINALAQIPDLKVAGRNSAFRFRSGDNDAAKVGATLGVATVLEGSVQKAGDEVRITTQLVNARDGFQLWSEKYDRKLTSIFAVEDEISDAIADKLRVQLDGRRQTRVARRTTDPRAHDFYLHGLPLIAARGPALLQAAADFQQAVAIDPDYAQAWAALAETQMLLPHYFLAPEDTAFPAGEAAARRALAIDPEAASAYVALAMMYRQQWRWQEADAQYQRALKIAPGDSEAANQYGQFLLARGHLSEALAEIDRAKRLDPLSAVIAATRTNVLMALHRFDEAEAEAARMVSAHRDFALGQYVAADVAIYRHDYALANSRLEAGAKIIGENPDVYLLLVRGIADRSRRAAAVRAALAATTDTRQRLTQPARIKWLMLLGDRDDALAMLQSAGRDIVFGQDNVWQPAFDPVRNDPRFVAALKRMGLATAQDASP